MKSRLLSRRSLETLAGSSSLPGLISALTKTAYRKPVEDALARTTGMDCIDEALRDDLVNTLGKIKKFYPERAGELVAILLRSYDVYNLRAILRGLSKNATAAEILATLLPVGELNPAILSALAHASNPRAAVDQSASMNLVFSRPLLALRAEYPGAETPEMEAALMQWYFRTAIIELRDGSGSDKLLCSALQLDADLDNLLVVLRLAYAPAERKLASSRSGSRDVERLFVGPGRLGFDLLERTASQDTLEAAVRLLAGTPYASLLEAGLDSFTRSGRLSEFEKQLVNYRLGWMTGMILKDPLGIGVVLGYVALKINEIGNLRWIGYGINLGTEPKAILLELVYPP